MTRRLWQFADFIELLALIEIATVSERSRLIPINSIFDRALTTPLDGRGPRKENIAGHTHICHAQY